jgi:F-type H+-transporting ATPase subunit epsilon
VANQLHVDVVSVEQKVWSGDADMLVARTTEGELGILAGHAPLLGQLAEPSQIRIKRSEGDLAYDVAGGFLSVDASGVTVLAESCQPASSAAEAH